MKKLVLLMLFISVNAYGVAFDSWIKAASGITDRIVKDIVINGSSIYSACEGGIYKSTNKGVNWTRIDVGIPNTYFRSIAFYGDRMYVGSSGGGAYYTTDDGVTWTAANTGLDTYNKKVIMDIFVNGSDMWIATYNGVYYSSDGVSWTQKNVGITPVVQITRITKIGTTLFAGTSNSGVYRSADNGENWTQVNSGLGNLYIEDLTVKGAKLFAATSAGIYLTENNGALWAASNSGISFADDEMRCIVVAGDDLYAGSVTGVFKSTNDGANWTSFSTGLTTSDERFIYSLAGNEEILYAGTHNNGVFYRYLAPEITTSSVFNIQSSGATVNGSITSGVATVRGVCWNTAGSPTMSDFYVSESGAFTSGGFMANISDLSPNTIYKVRAFATNNTAIAYGNELTFTTIPTLGEWGLILFGGIIALIGGVVVWRRLV